MVLSFEQRVNSTSPVWIPEPNGRGTWTVLSSCVVTTSLCVWSAVHLNVPQKGRAWSQYLRKFKWLFIGLIAPELVAYVAWQQRYEARELLREIAKLRRQKLGQGCQSKIARKFKQLLSNVTRRPQTNPLHLSPMSESLNLDTPWTLVHGFYAFMGGFAFTTDPKMDPFLPSSYNRATITPEGIRFLLTHEPDALPSLTEAQILDKSKADGLKKTLVCAQATWFCVQCITRLAQNLPISLLELNTFAHALCTLVIYVLWWKKPLDVDEPTEISDLRLSPIFAYMWMSSKISAEGCVGYDIGGRLRDEFDCIWPFENPVLGDLVLQPRAPKTPGATNTPFNESQLPPGNHNTSNPEISVPNPGRPSYTWRMYPSTTYTLYKLLTRLHLSNFLPASILPHPPAGLFTRHTAISSLSPLTTHRWSLAHSAIQLYNLETDLRSRHATPVNGRHLRSRLKLRQWNIVLNIRSVQLALAVTVSGILYGGIHLVAWDATEFPSPVEKMLWRISALMVAGNGMMLALYGRLLSSHQAEEMGGFISTWMPGRQRKVLAQQPLSSDKDPRAPKMWLRLWRWMGRLVWSMLLITGSVTMPLLWFSYVLARVYLVVESLRTLAYLPPGAFQTPSWPAYFPHIT